MRHPIIRRWTHIARVTLVSLMALIAFQMSGLGTSPLGLFGVAHAKPQPPTDTPDVGRFVPYINAPQLPVGSWTPKQSTAPHSKSQPATGRTPASGRNVGEQADLRTAASSTILNSDGTWTLKSYPVPVHYQDAQGNWQNIDDTVVSDSTVAGYGYGNKANGWQVHFAHQSGGPKLLHLRYPNLTLAEALQGAATVTATASGSQVVYPGVFPGVDLRYLVGNAHLEETLLLQNAQTPSSYTFAYHVPGATAQQDAQGDIVFLDASGNVLLVVGGIAMYESDAQGQLLPTSQATGNVAVTLSGTSPNYSVTLTPDQSWLSAPARHFPVAIDPTFSGVDNGSSNTDTFDESGHPTWNFYTTNTERIGNCNAIPSGATGYGTGTNRSYIKFGIGSAPAGVRVTSAIMSLYQLSAYGGGTTIAADEIKAAWTSSTLTWNNHPTNVAMVGSSAERTSYNVWWQVDVTQAVYDWWQNGQSNYGLRLRYTDESKPCDLFSSDDRGITNELPQLTVNYVQDTTAPGGSLTINGGASATNSATVTLGTTVTDNGSITEWGSNWANTNGLGANGGTAAHWVANGTQLAADTSSCGATNCPAQTFIPSNASSWSNVANWPTFTAMFKSDLGGAFNFGMVASGNNGTRFDLVAAAGSSAFTSLEYSTASGSYTSIGVNIPFTANTWYYGQVDFPQSSLGEIYIWPVGQTKPTVPTVIRNGAYMAQPGLNFWEQGDNGSGLHTYTIANVIATAKDTGSGTTGYGVYGMEFSNNGSTWSCPAGGTWCVAAASQPTWTLTAGDGTKTVSLRTVDNAGKISATATDQIVYDTTAPTASILSPTAGRDVRGVVTVIASATDPTAGDGSHADLASVALYDNGVQVGSPVAGTNTPTFLWDTTNIGSGRHVLTVRATDNAGNVGAASAGVAVAVSNTGQMSYETYALRDLPAGDIEDIKAGVNVATGNAVVTEQDIDVAGRGPDLALGRDYNALVPSPKLFGYGWTSDLDESIYVNADNSVVYYDASGGVHLFLPNGQGGYITPPGLFLTLVHNQDGSYTLASRDQTKTNFNAAGYVSSVIDRNGNALTIAYDGNNLPTTMTDGSGRTLTFTTSGGHITHIAAPGSRSFDYAYDGSGNLTDFTDPQGVITHYDYDANHRLTKITLNYQAGGSSDAQTNVATTLGYDAANRLVSLVDPMGFDAGISYGAAGSWSTQVKQLWTNASTTPSSGSSVYQNTTYSAAIDAGLGQLVSDGSGAVTEITDALGKSTSYKYNNKEQPTDVTAANGTVTSYSYDGAGNVLTRVVDQGTGSHLKLTTTWTYDSANNVLTQTDPRGIVTKYTYDTPATGNVITTVQHYESGGPNNSDTNVTTSNTYDSYGEALTATDALGVVTKYTYDSYGDTLTTIENYQSGEPSDDHTNVTTSATYDDLGEQLTATNALGIVTATVYDIRGNVQQTTANYQSGGPSDDHTNVKTQYGYDALGRQITTTNPRGIVTKTVYDSDGRVVQTIANYVSGGTSDSQTNVTTTTAYDGAGNATEAVDAKGNKTTTTYDADNRIIETKVADGGNTVVQDTVTTYDGVDNKLTSQVIDNNNNPTTTFTYDAANRLLTQTDPPANPGASDQSGQSNVTTYSYNANGNVLETQVTNAAVPGSVTDTTATFDALGRQLSKTMDADTGSPKTTSYVYDAGGRQTSMTDEANKTTSSGYDALGRVTSVTHPDTTVDTTTYDAAGEKLTQANSAGTTTDTYDPLGRVSTEQRKNGGGISQGIVAYTYDADGNALQKVTTLADNSQVTTVSTFDALDRQATMNDGTRSYTYDLAGNVTHMEVVVSGSGYAVQADSTYDGGNRIASLYDKVGPSATILHSYGYIYDGRGNRSSITEDGATTTNYSYDDLNQLTQVKVGSTVTATYGYDANHNRTSLVTAAGTTSYIYDDSDKLTQKTDPDGKVTNYAYDTSGNLTSASYDPTGVNQVTAYHYDANGRLTEIDQPSGTTIQYGYDADNNRTTKTITSGGVSHSVNDVYVLGHLAYETDQSGTVLATFTYDSGGVPVSVQVGSDPNNSPRYYYVYNGHGDVVALVDTSGGSVASYAYDAFGKLTAASENFGSGATWTNPYRYDGRDGVRYDGETGLYWMTVRAYDPELGRFLSRDPLNRSPLFSSDQPYVYGGNNPLINVDPSGQRLVGVGAVSTGYSVSHRTLRIIPWWRGLAAQRLAQSVATMHRDIARIIQSIQALASNLESAARQYQAADSAAHGFSSQTVSTRAVSGSSQIVSSSTGGNGAVSINVGALQHVASVLRTAAQNLSYARGYLGRWIGSPYDGVRDVGQFMSIVNAQYRSIDSAYRAYGPSWAGTAAASYLGEFQRIRNSLQSIGNTASSVVRQYQAAEWQYESTERAVAQRFW